jgi:DNA-binding LacI/PurR family transcriptional regulator
MSMPVDEVDDKVFWLPMRMLDEEGYVERKNGVGCFVADATPKLSFSDSIGVCMQAQAHLYGPLSRMIGSELHDRGLLSFIIDPGINKGREALLSAARSDIRAFVISADIHFPVNILDSPHFDDVSLVSVVTSQISRFSDLHHVLSDGVAEARIVASHLWEKGHRRILVGSYCSLLESPDHYRDGNERYCRLPTAALSFVEQWQERGGELDYFTVSSRDHAPYVGLNEPQQLLGYFPHDRPPTAIFGTYDVATLVAQRCLRENRPDLVDDIELVGYYDTPWSQAAHPPFSSVNLNLEEIARRTSDILQKIMLGEEIDEPVQFVEPRLVER